MKSISKLVLVAMAVMLAGSAVFAVESNKKGATPGKWTMDLEAAKKVAAEMKLPILLNFSGSDWCGWCKIMEKNVFAKKEWSAYAKENLLMVLLDFPSDSSLVPKEFVARNEELHAKYEVSGFPTFIVLDDDGETLLTRLVAGREKTPASFSNELAMSFRYRTAEVEKYVKGLSKEDKAAYLKLVADMKATSDSVEQQNELIESAIKKIKDLDEKSEELKASAAEFRAAQMGEDKLKEYKDLKTKLDAARKKLTDWLQTEPERTEANSAKYETMSASIDELQTKIAVF